MAGHVHMPRAALGFVIFSWALIWVGGAALARVGAVWDDTRLLEEIHAAKLAGDREAIANLEEARARALGEPIRKIPARPQRALPPHAMDLGKQLTEGGRWLAEDVRVSASAGDQRKPSLACQVDGTLWSAHLGYFSSGIEHAVYIHRSQDGGQSWELVRVFPAHAGTDVSTAIGEGDENYLLVAYESTENSITVMRQSLDVLDDYDFTLIEDNNYGMANPRIVTDADEYTGWYAYLIYNFNEGDGWVIHDLRTTDAGESWEGGGFLLAYRTTYEGENGHPDLDYGSRSLYLAFDSDEDVPAGHLNIWFTVSDDYGVNWRPNVQLTTSTNLEYGPEIAVVKNYSSAPTAVLAYTRDYEGQDVDAMYIYTQDDGATWSSPDALSSGYNDESGVNVAAGADPSYIYAVYQTENDIEYTRAPYDDPGAWRPPVVVNQESFVSAIHPRPGIAIDPICQPEEGLCLTWTDWRSDGLDGYDVYFNRHTWPFAEAQQDPTPTPTTVLQVASPARWPARVVYSLPRPTAVRLAVLDAQGREVCRLIGGERQTAGRRHVGWDGLDGRGRRVPSGCYFIRLQTDAGSALARTIVLDSG